MPYAYFVSPRYVLVEVVQVRKAKVVPGVEAEACFARLFCHLDESLY